RLFLATLNLFSLTSKPLTCPLFPTSLLIANALFTVPVHTSTAVVAFFTYIRFITSLRHATCLLNEITELILSYLVYILSNTWWTRSSFVCSFIIILPLQMTQNVIILFF